MSKIFSLSKVFFTCLIAVLLPASVFAYVGPGAGFAVAGSFFVMFVAILSAFLVLLTWPARYLIKTIRYRKVAARSRIKKTVVLGLDGLDYSLINKFMDDGKLPNFTKLKDSGSFKPLASTVPPISPVAWSTFQTGSNPGKHNIFDFLTRDKKTYAAILSSTSIKGPSKYLSLGKYRIPLGKADIRLLRKSIPFWKTLGDNGVFSSIIRVPITFPPEKFNGIQLSAMCAPDLRGTQGMFSYYSTGQQDGEEHTGGEYIKVEKKNDSISSVLVGPVDPMVEKGDALKCPFSVDTVSSEKVVLKIAGETYDLKKGEYSDWIKVEFKASLGVKISGVCLFLVKDISPEFKLYVSPINLDPAKPAMPISHPKVYSTYLSKRQGSYATLGLAEDSWALNEKILSDEDFFKQCTQMDSEREKMFFDSLENIKQGLCVCVFDGTDRVQHSFWREIDKEHPSHDGDFKQKENPAIEQIYKRADTLLGKTIEKCLDKDTLLMVISDHGFNTFRRGIDLNRWLEENGYLKLKDSKRYVPNLANVDWSQTKAFAIGLTGMYLNIKGREAQGIVEEGKEAAGLREEIAEKLCGLTDPNHDVPAIKHVYNARKVYVGPYKNEAPDLIVGYHIGYRASWDTAVGKVTEKVFHDNCKAWSGDHCIDRSLVPGVLFCNRKIDDEQPRLMDIGPTVLDMFGVSIPSHMDGKPLKVADRR
jgi:predicted AlkP superfamily phosphohydrolase/phosphomutase